MRKSFKDFCVRGNRCNEEVEVILSIHQDDMPKFYEYVQACPCNFSQQVDMFNCVVVKLQAMPRTVRHMVMALNEGYDDTVAYVINTYFENNDVVLIEVS